jgi:hypothetical protein
MEQLMALDVQHGDQDSAAKSLASIETKQVEEKDAQAKAQTEAMTLSQVVEYLKMIANRFAAQIPILEEKVEHQDNKVLDGLTEMHAKELNLERTTKANEDYKSQNTWLTQKL